MSSGDIVKLSRVELDFKHNKITFVQQKTGEALQLPMLSEVKEALTDYINNARPKVAGIDIAKKKHGPHTFRSSLASSMINDDVPYEVVTKILGNADPDAIKHYAKLDIEKLRECAIEVPKPSGSFKTFLDGGTKA